MSRAAQIVLFERFDIGKRPIDKFLFFVVVRYKRYRFYPIVILPLQCAFQCEIKYINSPSLNCK